ncbi:hypothetical protein HY492_01910 [Candidatus Woesearchaeota archaeon]|nr:hypothetical protein [Candidatus Woesearchaeota archaeon]
MKLGMWVSGKSNGQVLLNWAMEQKHTVGCFLTMEPKHPLPWATGNLDALKKVSDSRKIDLLFKSVKESGDENFAALDALIKFAKDKYGVEAISVSREPGVAQPIRNAAKKLKLKTVLQP